MPNRQLTAEELAKANLLLDSIRAELGALSGGDRELLFAYRRKIAKQLTYDERSSPMARRALKIVMRERQKGLCAACSTPLPESYNALDRFNAIDGYIETNVQLICEPCDRDKQRSRNYT